MRTTRKQAGKGKPAGVLTYRCALLRSGGELLLRNLIGAGAEQELDDVPFVRLQPVELDRGDRSDVEPVDVRGVGQGPLEF